MPGGFFGSSASQKSARHFLFLLKNHWLSFAVILAGFIWANGQLSGQPDQVPIHFNWQGQPDRYGSKSLLLYLLPALSLFVVILLGLVSTIPIKGFKKTDDALVSHFSLLTTLLMMAIYIGWVLEPTRPGSFLQVFAPAFSIFMILMGRSFRSLERNPFIGIRLPWTLASDENWKEAHKFGGRIYMICGALALALCFLPITRLIVVPIFIIPTVITIGYSYMKSR